MAYSTFDTLTYANKLKDAGCNEILAEVHAHELSKIINNNLSTKSDISELELILKKDIKNTELKLIKCINENSWRTITLLATFQMITIGLFTFLQHFL